MVYNYLLIIDDNLVHFSNNLLGIVRIMMIRYKGLITKPDVENIEIQLFRKETSKGEDNTESIIFRMIVTRNSDKNETDIPS